MIRNISRRVYLDKKREGRDMDGYNEVDFISLVERVFIL